MIENFNPKDSLSQNTSLNPNGSIKGSVTAIVGAQWGDEGKGKIVDALASKFQYVVRFQGGANAGHTINNNFGRFALHLLPSGVFESEVVNVLGPGVALHIPTFINEMEELLKRNVPAPKIYISDRAQVVLEGHILADQYREENQLGGRTYGSTKTGIAPFYSAKFAKKGIRIGEILNSDNLLEDVASAIEDLNVIFEFNYNRPKLSASKITDELLSYRDKIRPFVTSTNPILKQALLKGDSILVEGQLGALRDPDHGIYPYSTSSSTLAGHATVGAGIPPYALNRVIAVVKAYSSKVGIGPFPVELEDHQLAKELRQLGGDKGEFGATTGRPRDVGWFDAVATSYGVSIQGATEIALTNLDVLGHFENLPICVAYNIKGKDTKEFPLNSELATAKPVFKELPSWNVSKEELSKVTDYNQLPDNAKRYVETIEELCSCKVSMVSVGPKREQLIYR